MKKKNSTLNHGISGQLPQAGIDPYPNREEEVWKDSAPGRWVHLAERFKNANSINGYTWRPFKEFQYWYDRYHTHILLYEVNEVSSEYTDNRDLSTPIKDTFVTLHGVYDNLNSLSEKIQSIISNRSKFKDHTYSYGKDIEGIYQNASVNFWSDQLSITINRSADTHTILYAVPVGINITTPRLYADPLRFRNLDTARMNASALEMANTAMENIPAEPVHPEEM